MAFKLPKAKNFDPAPAGTHLARCIGIIDLGSRMVSYQGQPKGIERQIRFTFELVDEKMRDGRPFVIGTGHMSVLTSPKANFRKFLEVWRGKPFDDAELGPEGTFDIKKLAGLPCMVTVSHEVGKDGDAYARIANVVKPVKGMTVAAPANPVVVVLIEADEFDRKAYDTLNDKTKALIEASPEWAILHGKNPNVETAHSGDDMAEAMAGADGAIEEDDIPF